MATNNTPVPGSIPDEEISPVGQTPEETKAEFAEMIGKTVPKPPDPVPPANPKVEEPKPAAPAPAKVEPPPATPVPVTPVPPVTPPAEEQDPLMEEISKLAREKAELENKLLGTATPVQPVAPTTPAPPAPTPAPPVTPSPAGFDMLKIPDTMMASLDPVERKEIIDFVQEAFKSAVNAANSTAVNHVTDLVTPRAGVSPLDQRVHNLLAVQRFWDRNTDIAAMVEDEKYAGLTDFIKAKADNIQAKNPKFTLSQVYTETEKEVRALLGDRLKKFEKPGDKKVTPSALGLLGNPPRSRTTAPATNSGLTDEQVEFQEMIRAGKS
jgi:hypothetical protein